MPPPLPMLNLHHIICIIDAADTAASWLAGCMVPSAGSWPTYGCPLACKSTWKGDNQLLRCPLKADQNQQGSVNSKQIYWETMTQEQKSKNYWRYFYFHTISTLGQCTNPEGEVEWNLAQQSKTITSTTSTHLASTYATCLSSRAAASPSLLFTHALSAGSAARSAASTSPILLHGVSFVMILIIIWKCYVIWYI